MRSKPLNFTIDIDGSKQHEKGLYIRQTVTQTGGNCIDESVEKTERTHVVCHECSVNELEVKSHASQQPHYGTEKELNKAANSRLSQEVADAETVSGRICENLNEIRI